VFALFKVG